jgi:hypothetical protein
VCTTGLNATSADGLERTVRHLTHPDPVPAVFWLAVPLFGASLTRLASVEVARQLSLPVGDLWVVKTTGLVALWWRGWTTTDWFACPVVPCLFCGLSPSKEGLPLLEGSCESRRVVCGFLLGLRTRSWCFSGWLATSLPFLSFVTFALGFFCCSWASE